MRIIPELLPDASAEVFTKRYKPIKYLGEGGWGEVFLALDQEGKYHAVKRALNSETVGSLQREALALLYLDHPGVIKLEELCADERSFPVLVLEYCPGESLKTKVSEGWSDARVWRLAFDLAEILRYIHRQGVLHLDIKPGNILLQGETVKLLDFGFARCTPRLTSDPIPQMLGYSAPELSRGVVRKEADYYSMGVSLFACVQGTTAVIDIFTKVPKWRDPGLAQLISGLLSEGFSERQRAFDML